MARMVASMGPWHPPTKKAREETQETLEESPVQETQETKCLMLETTGDVAPSSQLPPVQETQEILEESPVLETQDTQNCSMNCLDCFEESQATLGED